MSVVNGRSIPFNLDNNGNVTCASLDAGSGAIQTFGPISCHNITSVGSILTNDGTSNTSQLTSNGDLTCNTINSFVASNLVDLSTAQNLTNKTFSNGITTSNITAITGNQIFYNLSASPVIALPNTASPLGGLAIAFNQSNTFGETNLISYVAGDISTGGFELSCVNLYNNNLVSEIFKKRHNLL